MSSCLPSPCSRQPFAPAPMLPVPAGPYQPRTPVHTSLLRTAVGLTCALLLSGCAWLGKKPPENALSDGGPPSYTLRVELLDSKNKDIQALLEKHLDLQRYRVLSDLSDAEMAALMEKGEADATQLLQTQGYFKPEVRITRSAGNAGSSAGGSTARMQAPGSALPGATPVTAPAPMPEILVQVRLGPASVVSEAHIRYEGHIASTRKPDIIRQRRLLRRDWLLPKGQRFTQDGWDAAKTRAERDLTAERYLAGKVSSSSANILTDTDEAEVAITLDSGPVYHFGPTQISGLQHYSPEMVNRFLRIDQGKEYSLADMLQAQQRLNDSGFFDSVFLYMDPKSDPANTPVQVQLSEAKLQKLVLGLGVSSDSGPRISVEHIHNLSPFFGWRSRTKLGYDKRSAHAEAEVMSQPNADYWRWVLGGAWQRDRDETYDLRSETVRAGRIQTSERIDRSIYAEFNRSTLSYRGSDAPNYRERNSALSLNWAWTFRNFDSIVFPTSGWGLGIEAGGGYTLGNNGQQRKPFGRTVVRWNSFHPLSDYFAGELSNEELEKRGRIALRGTLGAVNTASDYIPAKLLFTAGGDSSVRGYPYRSIGTGVSTPSSRAFGVPGKYLLVGSAEWQKPIYRRGLRTDWESVVFIDSGTVADKLNNFTLYTGVGVGARWRSPIGPFQIDAAYGLKTRKPRLHLSVGFVF